ncbi:MAG: flagellar basal-body MS-ring/collar protein FliF [Pseudomonadota bacterium]
MADLVPATATAGSGAGEAPVPSLPPVSVPGSDFLRGALSMPMTRQLLLMLALAGSVAAAVSAVLWMRAPDYRPLATLQNAYDAQAMTAALDGAAIPYRLDERAGLILVRESEYHRARMQLAGADVLGDSPSGYELLDRDQGFGVSQATESMQHRRSLEGELARSIATISAVRSARVLLAQPRRSAFVRDRRKATAAVTVTVAPGRRLESEQVMGIANLVAGAVPELAAEDVTVIDQSGVLLSEQDMDPTHRQNQFQLEYTAALEDKLRRKVTNILAPSLGLTGFSAEVAVEVDFTRTEQTEELYNPDLTAVRSEAAVNEETSGDAPLAQGIPGALANDPAETEANAAPEEAAPPRRTRSQVTKNYEVDRTISHTRHASALMTRLSVSVIVDDKPVVTPATPAEGATEDEGETQAPAATAEPWTEAELERLAALVRNAVGYSAARGDSVTIINRPFLGPAVAESAAVPIWEQPWLRSLAKQLLGGIAILLVIFGLIRPLFRNLSQAGAVVKEQHTMAIARLAEQSEEQRALAATTAASGAVPLGSPQVAGLLPGSTGSGPGAGTEMTSKLEAIRSIVSEDPERAAQVVKHWVSNDDS